MSAVQYDLDADEKPLVDGLEAAVRSMTKAEAAADDLTKSMELVGFASKEAGTSAKKAAEGTNAAKTAFDGATQAAAALGGKVGGAAGLLKGLAEGAIKADAALGPIGGSLAAGAAGATALVFAGVKLSEMLLELGRDAVASEDKVKEFLGPEDRANLAIMREQFSDLDDRWLALKATLASELSPEIGNLLDMLTGTVVVATELSQGLDRLHLSADLAEDMARFVGGEQAADIAGTSLATVLIDIGRASQTSLAGVLGGWEEVKPVVVDHEKALALVAKDYAEIDAASRAAAAAEAEALRQVDAALKRGEQVQAQMASAASAEMKRQVELSNSVSDSAIQQWAEVKALGEKAVAESEKQTADFEAKLKKRQAQILGGLESLAQSTTEIISTVLQAQLDNLAVHQEAIDNKITASQSRLEQLRAGNSAANAADIAEEEARLKALEQQRHGLALKAFREQQTSDVANAIMAGALGIMQSYAQLGPIGGSIAAAGVAAITAVQVGIIESQAPPAHDGGMLQPDEFMALNRRMREGESVGVFSQRSTETGAAARAVDGANKERRGQDQPVRLVLADFGRVVGEAIARDSRRPGSRFSPAFGRSASTDPYRSR